MNNLKNVLKIFLNTIPEDDSSNYLPRIIFIKLFYCE
jgi:hypothetical protein